MQNFRKLAVWQKAHEITLVVYRISSTFPSDERFGLTSQIRRCASSVPANIAEGSARGSDADYARFLQIALGSSAELDYHLLLAHDLEFLDLDTCNNLSQKIETVGKMLNAFIQKLRST